MQRKKFAVFLLWHAIKTEACIVETKTKTQRFKTKTKTEPSKFESRDVSRPRLKSRELHHCHCTRRGPSSRERATAVPSFWPMSIVATVAHLSYC